MDASTLTELRELTQLNLVGDAYQLAAETLGLVDLAEQFADVNRRHLNSGALTWELNFERHMLYEKLMAYAKTFMDDEEYQRFYMLF